MISISSTFTKDINVYYDSLFHVEKINQTGNSLHKHDILTIYKLDFNYSDASINQKNIPLKIDFSDSGKTPPFEASKSCYVGSILLESEKCVLIVGLEWISANLTQTIGSQTHVGDAYNPIIYKYDINNHTSQKLYPKSEDLAQWTSFLQGDKISAQVPLISYDPKNNRLGFILKTTRTVNSVNTRTYIDIDFIYRKDALELENVRVLSAEDTNGVYNSSINFQKYINHNGQKLLIAAGSKKISRVDKKKVLIFKLGASENSTVDPNGEYYLLTEDGFELVTEDGESLMIE
jgi:hypothetical protein